MTHYLPYDAAPAQAHDLRRVAMVSLHTSPLDQPGTGDAGGMNVYVLELARRLAARQVEVDVFTRSTGSGLPPVVDVSDGIRVHHVSAGPYEGLTKHELPAQLCVFAREVLRTEAYHSPGYYDLVHSHYWLSGQVGALARDRWGVPLVHTMHTMAKVKNAAMAVGDTPEPMARLIGEEQVVAAADMLVANTDDEARQLIDLYDADPGRVEVVHPGVDLTTFRDVGTQAARARLGLAADGPLITFVGRIQPLKAPDVMLRGVAVLLEQHPELRSTLTVAVVGGPSGSGLERPDSLVRLAEELGIDALVRFVPPGLPGRAGRLVRRVHAGLRAVVQRELRAGRRRGPGLRDTGRGGSGRRASHRGARRSFRPARERPRACVLRRGVRAGAARARAARPARGGCGGPCAAVRLGPDRCVDALGLRPCPGEDARGPERARPVGEAP